MYSTNQLTGFCMKFSTGLKWINVSSHQNKKGLSPFYHKKYELPYITPIGCLTFIFYQKYFL